MKSCIRAQNEDGRVVVNITTWILGRESGLGEGVVVALALAVLMGMVLAAVLRWTYTSLWCLKVSRSTTMAISLLTAFGRERENRPELP